MSARDAVTAFLHTTRWGDAHPALARERSDAILSALAAAGYAVVPVKPTEAMLAAGEEERRWVRMSRQRVRLESHWGAMLAAAKETQA